MALVNESTDILFMQSDIDTISSLEITWDLNVKKSKVMHIGDTNGRFDYTIFNKFGTVSLAKRNLEKDLGVNFQNDLKWNAQVNFSSGKANKFWELFLKILNL
ncbi:unnamed protein product [Brachionus calyciflorus]|uniref:Uncharacterized protein n=1 Tax=Brachionus calyciflorus TaxID=104777 RepID=A0A813ZB07_9BILA|nr:unnamed protein product [Brachionus calyciflorus]